jgi:hypothetical protein
LIQRGLAGPVPFAQENLWQRARVRRDRLEHSLHGEAKGDGRHRVVVIGSAAGLAGAFGTRQAMRAEAPRRTGRQLGSAIRTIREVGHCRTYRLAWVSPASSREGTRSKRTSRREGCCSSPPEGLEQIIDLGVDCCVRGVVKRGRKFSAKGFALSPAKSAGVLLDGRLGSVRTHARS